MRTAVALLMFASILAGCESADPRRAVAERFIDQLFVRIDQHAARELTTGLATSKIDEEIRLKAGQQIDESTRQPSVAYGLVQASRDDGPTASLVYDLHVSPDGADTFTQRLVLTVRKEGDAWKVSNYTLEAPPVPGE
jgi:hypothetical protein